MQSTIRKTIERFDECWLKGRWTELEALVLPHATILAAGGTRVTSRDAFVDSYREFMSRCEVRELVSSIPHVTIHDRTACAEYAWRMRWLSDGKELSATGRELLVLVQTADRWQILSRAQLQVAE